jgi:GNAT superfamily N-acetyltransferase
MNPAIRVPETPTFEHRDAVLGPLVAFNAENGYPGDLDPVAVLIEAEDGSILGGLWGKTIYGWLCVEYLAVPEALRGQDFGTRLMEEAERIARERGCAGAWLTTFTFQARGFYEKLGYELFGELDHSPGTNVRLFLRKKFPPEGSGSGE